MYNNSEKSAIINIQIEKNHIFVCFKEITVNFVFDFPLIEGNLTLLNKRRNQQ